MAITTTFATVNCTGNPIKISQNAVNIPQPYIPYGCIQFSCETSSTSLPLDSSLSFTVIEYYDVGENVCVNAMLALAEVNDVCVNFGVNASIYAHYPWAASYRKAGCNPSDLEFNVTYPSGCTNKDSTGDDDDFYVIPNKASASSAYSPLIVEPFFPLSFDAEDVSTATGMLRGAAEDNKVPVEEMVAAFIERHQARLIRLNEQNLAKKKRQEGKNDPRELSIWYGNDNNDDSGTPTETAQVFFVPAASSSSSSNTLSAGAIAGIAIGAAAFCTMAVVIIAVFVFGSSTVLGWCGLKMAGEGNKKGGDDGDDVAPSTEMSFDYGSQKSSISGVTSVVNPILARPSNPTA